MTHKDDFIRNWRKLGIDESWLDSALKSVEKDLIEVEGMTEKDAYETAFNVFTPAFVDWNNNKREKEDRKKEAEQDWNIFVIALIVSIVISILIGLLVRKSGESISWFIYIYMIFALVVLLNMLFSKIAYYWRIAKEAEEISSQTNYWKCVKCGKAVIGDINGPMGDGGGSCLTCGGIMVLAGNIQDYKFRTTNKT